MRGNIERSFSHFSPFILGPTVLNKGGATSVGWQFREFAASCRTLPHPEECFYSHRTVTELSKGPFHCFRLMDNMVRLVNSTSTSLLPHFICCKISYLARSKGNTMMANKMLKILEVSQKHFRPGRQTHIMSKFLWNVDKRPPFHDRSALMQLAHHQRPADSLEMVLFQGLSVGPSFGWVGHSAVAIARSATVSRNSWCWAQAYSHLCHHGYFVHDPIGQRRWLKKGTWQKSTECVILTIIKILLCWVWALLSICMQHSVPTESSIHLLLPQTFSSPRFQPRWCPWSSSKPLAAAHEAMYIHTSDYLSFQTQWTTRDSAECPAHWGNSSSLFFWATPECASSDTAICFWMITKMSHKVFYTQGPIFFCESAGHREHPVKPWAWVPTIATMGIWIAGLFNFLLPQLIDSTSS